MTTNREILKKMNEEASVSKIFEHIQNHDTGALFVQIGLGNIKLKREGITHTRPFPLQAGHSFVSSPEVSMTPIP